MVNLLDELHFVVAEGMSVVAGATPVLPTVLVLLVSVLIGLNVMLPSRIVPAVGACISVLVLTVLPQGTVVLTVGIGVVTLLLLVIDLMRTILFIGLLAVVIAARSGVLNLVSGVLAYCFSMLFSRFGQQVLSWLIFIVQLRDRIIFWVGSLAFLVGLFTFLFGFPSLSVAVFGG